jgi:hypothetical protein
MVEVRKSQKFFLRSLSARDRLFRLRLMCGEKSFCDEVTTDKSASTQTV